ncbi:MAG: peptidylprolyl isomerase [Dehalococcoidia bacterium]|jgi:parvulin-like peptidyl-prolyl isomerase|nr:peptidylprolyl isomerase [Dehalococcoidia bacterium]
MTKKTQGIHPHLNLSIRASSRIERQAKIQRLLVIGSAVFLGAILLVVGIGLYVDRVAPSNDVVLEVNGRQFTLGYYANALEAYSKGLTDIQLATITDSLATQIAREEVVRQGAAAEGIVPSSADIKAQLESQNVPSNNATRDMVAASLASAAMKAPFQAELPATMEQVKFEIMLVESRPLAAEVEAAVARGEPLAGLAEKYSVNTAIPVTQDYVPADLLLNADVANMCRTLPPGQSAIVLDEDTVKSVGYWLIEVVDRDDDGSILPRVMLLGTMDAAVAARARLATEDFGVVAAEVSQYTTSDESAEIGWLAPADVVSAAFNQAAFALELNTVSEPIRDIEAQTTGGYWFVRLLDRSVQTVSVTSAGSLAAQDVNEWYTALAEVAVIETSLSADQKTWAIERVTG